MIILAPGCPIHEDNVTVRACHGNVLMYEGGSVFGYSLDQDISFDDYYVPARHFFCCTARRTKSFVTRGHCCMITVDGYFGHPLLIGQIDHQGPGRVAYIDDCTDSLLVCPPKWEEPCLNALYFPPDISQTFHSHPELRAGMIIAGRGWAETEHSEIPLVPGDTWHIAANELHRFRTTDRPMTVLAFHPRAVGFGPRDDDQPMLNGTNLKEKHYGT